MKSINLKVVLVLICLLKSSIGFCQVSNNSNNLESKDSIKSARIMLDLYLGVCNMNTSKFDILSGFGGGFGLNISRTKDNFVEKIRLSYNEDNYYMTENQETITDLGLLFGLYGQEGHAYVDISTGLSIVGGTKIGNYLYENSGLMGNMVYQNISYVSIGLPFEARLMYDSKLGGFGLSFQGNLNPKIPYYGLYLTARINNIIATKKNR